METSMSTTAEDVNPPLSSESTQIELPQRLDQIPLPPGQRPTVNTLSAIYFFISLHTHPNINFIIGAAPDVQHASKTAHTSTALSFAETLGAAWIR